MPAAASMNSRRVAGSNPRSRSHFTKQLQTPPTSTEIYCALLCTPSCWNENQFVVLENGAGCSTNCVVSEQGLEGRYERLLSQSSRALGSGPEGRWFESSRPDQNSKKCPWEEFDTLGLIHRASVPSNPHSVWGQIAPLQFPPVEDQSLQQLRRRDLADTI